jgi:predicted nucleotidyltransferase
MSTQERTIPELPESERAALRKLKDALQRDFRLIELRLFGSKARGDSTPESDIDVLVVLEDYDWQVEKAVYGLCYDVGLEFGIFISAALYSRREYTSRLTRATPFYRNVAREGVAV